MWWIGLPLLVVSSCFPNCLRYNIFTGISWAATIPQWWCEHGEFLLVPGQQFWSPKLSNTGLIHAEKRWGETSEHQVHDFTLTRELVLGHIVPDLISCEKASTNHHFPSDQYCSQARGLLFPGSFSSMAEGSLQSSLPSFSVCNDCKTSFTRCTCMVEPFTGTFAGFADRRSPWLECWGEWMVSLDRQSWGYILSWVSLQTRRDSDILEILLGALCPVAVKSRGGVLSQNYICSMLLRKSETICYLFWTNKSWVLGLEQR